MKRPGTHLVIFLLQESFARAKNWVKELQRQASPNIVIALSGNKADLASKRAVDFQVSAYEPRSEIFYIGQMDHSDHFE